MNLPVELIKELELAVMQVLTPFIFCKNFRRDKMSGFTTAGIMFFSAIIGGVIGWTWRGIRDRNIKKR